MWAKISQFTLIGIFAMCWTLAYIPAFGVASGVSSSAEP